MVNFEKYNAYLTAHFECASLEEKINNLQENWLAGKMTLDSSRIQSVIDKGYERLAQLRIRENQLYQEYLKEENRSDAEVALGYALGVRPTLYEVNSGVLSSDPNKSHLVATLKSKEQLALEKKQILSTIGTKLQAGELTMEEAEKLLEAVNTSYDYYDETVTKSGSGRK